MAPMTTRGHTFFERNYWSHLSTRMNGTWACFGKVDSLKSKSVVKDKVRLISLHSG